MEEPIVAIVFGVITALIANERGRNPLGWFFVGMFLPCIGLIILLVVPDLKEEEAKTDGLRLENRRLRERLRKDRQVSDARHSELSQRIELHDRNAGLDTGQIVGTSVPPALPAPPPIANPRGLEWYYVQDGERQGPVAFQTLRGLYQVADIDHETLVWCEEMEDWATIGQMKELEDALCA